LPSGRERAAAYRNLSDIALPEIRAWYRPIYDRIMAMTEPELIEFVASHRPPVAWFAQMQKSTVMVNPATDLAASYSSTPPTSWTTGQTQTYSVTLTNTGSQTWNATGVDRVVLSVHFGTSDDIPGVGWATEQRFALPADLAPGGSVTLSVTVTAPSATGGYVLRQRMFKEYVAWFAQMQKTTVMVSPATDLAANYSSTPPTSWTSGQTQTYSVTVTNTGSQTWSATGVNRVVLGVHFGTSDDTPGVGWATEQRFALPADLAAGGSVTLSVTVTAPSATGGYVLRQRMLTESVGDFGTAALSVYYYVGIPEGDDLGTRLYVEYVAANLAAFGRDVVSRSLDTSFVRVARPRVPLSDGLPGIELGPEEHGWRLLTLTSGAGWHPIYWSRAAVLWEPGRLFFGWLDALKPVPVVERAFYVLVVLALLFSRLTGFPDRLGRDLVATIGGGLIAYVVAINVVSSMRPVEAAAVWPLLCLTWAACLKWIGVSIRRLAVAAGIGRLHRVGGELR
jgi:hypothetical protein